MAAGHRSAAAGTEPEAAGHAAATESRGKSEEVHVRSYVCVCVRYLAGSLEYSLLGTVTFWSAFSRQLEEKLCNALQKLRQRCS